MIRSAVVRSALALSAILGLAASAFAEDKPTFHGVRVAIVCTDTDLSDEARTGIALFEQRFKTAHFNVEIVHSQNAVQVLNEDLDIALAIEGSFRKQADRPYIVKIYWRPDGKRWDAQGQETIQREEAVDKGVENAAHESIRYIEEKLQDALRLHRLQLKRDDRDSILDAALTAFRDQDYERSAERAKSLLNSDPNKEQSYRAHFILGHYYKQSRKYVEAIREFETAENLSDGDDSTLLELGNVEFLRDNRDTAKTNYKMVIERKGVNTIKARWNLVLLYLNEGSLDEAKAEFDKLPENTLHTLRRVDLEKMVEGNLREKKERDDEEATNLSNRIRFRSYLWRFLIGTAVLAVGALITTLYRRTQRDPSFTKEQKADAVGKLISGLFSILSLLAGTMVGLLLAK